MNLKTMKEVSLVRISSKKVPQAPQDRTKPLGVKIVKATLRALQDRVFPEANMIAKVTLVTLQALVFPEANMLPPLLRRGEARRHKTFILTQISDCNLISAKSAKNLGIGISIAQNMWAIREATLLRVAKRAARAALLRVAKAKEVEQATPLEEETSRVERAECYHERHAVEQHKGTV